MDSPKGGQLKESTHQVITIKAALEWFDGVLDSDMPIIVNQWATPDGRIALKIYNKDKKEIHRRG